MKRTIKDFLVIGIKGMGMGAADIVPGVSGGTIAFITNIYEELIDSIKSINLASLKLLFGKNGIAEFWKAINANFLLSVFIGIAVSVFSLAKVLKIALEQYPVMVWAFFFGLIIASAIIIAGGIKKWNISTVISLLVGIVIAYFITVLTPASTPEAYWFVFLCGALAICAMILPGISGAFILLLLGKYKFILEAVNDFNIVIILIFMVGAVVGLLSFSNVLSFFLKKYHKQTIALLAGFMIGSLNKVWPWKETIEWGVDSHGEKIALIQNNILPAKFALLNGESFFIWAVLLSILGFIFIIVIEKVTKKKH